MQRWLVVCMLVAGCSDARTAVSAADRYGCQTQADCLAGFTCLCGLCQPVAGPVVCAPAADAA